MSLDVLAYNLKRVIRILGLQQTMKAMLSMGGIPSCDQRRTSHPVRTTQAAFRESGLEKSE